MKTTHHTQSYCGQTTINSKFQGPPPLPPPPQGANPEHLTIPLVSAKWGIWPLPEWGREYDPEVSVKFLNFFGRSGCTHVVTSIAAIFFIMRWRSLKVNEWLVRKGLQKLHIYAFLKVLIMKRDRLFNFVVQLPISTLGSPENSRLKVNKFKCPGGVFPRRRCWSFELIGTYFSLFNKTSLSKWKKYGPRCVK